MHRTRPSHASRRQARTKRRAPGERRSLSCGRAVYATRDGGATWRRHDEGFPREQAWWTVKRQAMCGDESDPVGLYFGTTNGELWASDNEGASFRCLFRHLPHIFSVTAGEPA